LADLKQRNLDEVKALSRDEAVEIMRQAGIVGAGGGGFPTYFKWKNPQPNLIVNCTESEPGYWADKMLHREYFDEFLTLFDAMKTIFGIEKVIMGVHFKDEEWFSRYDESANGLYEVVHVPDTYAMGEEKTLIKNIFNEDAPEHLQCVLPRQAGYYQVPAGLRPRPRAQALRGPPRVFRNGAGEARRRRHRGGGR
jgi:electron transport complex protein RnfC